MRKFSFILFNVTATLATGFCSFFTLQPTIGKAEETGKYVYVCGKTAGFNLQNNGVQVLALSEFITKDGVCAPAKEAGLQPGDKITAIDGKEINTISELNSLLQDKEKVNLTIKRNGEEQKVTIKPQKELNGNKKKIGVLIRDSLSGIGTITYLDRENERFGALGHGVYDEDGKLLSAKQENIFDCGIVSVQKGVKGKAGELRGIFSNDQTIGKAEIINECGLFGSLNNGIDYTQYQKVETSPLSSAKIGAAYIYSTVEGFTSQQYEISIVKVDENAENNKNFVIKINDQDLIEKTGGIVQGMSGSPILQNGKIIGAVTHVFLNDPTRGYGIGIENMLSRQNSVL